MPMKALSIDSPGRDAALRLGRLPWKPLHTRITLALGIGWLLDSFEMNVIGNVLGLLQKLWHLTTVEARCDRPELAGRSPTPRTSFVGTPARWSLRSCFAGRRGTRALLSASPSRHQSLLGALAMLPWCVGGIEGRRQPLETLTGELSQ